LTLFASGAPTERWECREGQCRWLEERMMPIASICDHGWKMAGASSH